MRRPFSSTPTLAFLSLASLLLPPTQVQAAAAPRPTQTFDDHAGTFQPLPGTPQTFNNHASTLQPSATFAAGFPPVPTSAPHASSTRGSSHLGALVSDAQSMASSLEAGVKKATASTGRLAARASGPPPTIVSSSKSLGTGATGIQSGPSATPSSRGGYVPFGCSTHLGNASDHYVDTIHGLHTGQFPNGTAFPGGADHPASEHGGPYPEGAGAISAPSPSSVVGSKGGTWGGVYNPKPSNGTNHRTTRSRRQSPGKINVKVYMHVVTTAAHAGMVTQSQINQQITELNNAYNSHGVSFKLGNASFTTNDAWAVGGNDNADVAMKTALRQGTYADLNLYFQSDMAGGVLGQCTLPTNVGANPAPSVYVRDGCNIAAGTVPGGPINGYNMGKTAVHETGHWLGLLHTFEGYSCSGNGDYVADTPAESQSTDGCPTNPWKNTCTGRTGVDPIHNFMDYSIDSCYERFTPGQEQRIQSLWPQYRAGK